MVSRCWTRIHRHSFRWMTQRRLNTYGGCVNYSNSFKNTTWTEKSKFLHFSGCWFFHLLCLSTASAICWLSLLAEWGLKGIYLSNRLFWHHELPANEVETDFLNSKPCIRLCSFGTKHYFHQHQHCVQRPKA